MPVIHVEMFAGRSREQKEKFARAVTENFVSICGGTAQSVQVIFSEISKDDWATAGALASASAPQNSAANAD